MRATAVWLLCSILEACDSKGVGSKSQAAPDASVSGRAAPPKGCLSAPERTTFSLRDTWWSPAGLGYCVGAPQQDERCLELRVMPNAFVPFTNVRAQAIAPRANVHPLKRILWDVKSGVKLRDPLRAGQHDEFSIIETIEPHLHPDQIDSDDSSELVTQWRSLTADISSDHKHFAFINHKNALVVQALKPKGVDRFVVKTIHTRSLAGLENAPISSRINRLWWAGNRVVFERCVAQSCSLEFVDPMSAHAAVQATGIRTANSAVPLHAISERDFAVVNESGDTVSFFDFATGTRSRELALPRHSAEGAWSGKSGPYELAIVYGKPSLGDVVRVHLQKREVSIVNTAACD